VCNFTSFVLTIDREFWGPTDSHEDIIEHHALHADGAHGPNILRVEITPPDDVATREDLSTWTYRVDQDVLPEWAAHDPWKCEERARAALARRATADRWFVHEDAQQATVGYAGTATAGARGTATAGYAGTATAGNYGTATAGDYGTATAGLRGTATAGNYGTATAGDYGTATAGNAGTATAGVLGEIRIRYWDAISTRYRVAVGYIGEYGIEPGTAYVVTDGRLTRKDPV
jgi:hypothetical protein